MCWQVTAAIAASATLILSLSIFVLIPIWQRHRWGKVLPQLIELRDMAVDIQNVNWHDLQGDKLGKFEQEVEKLKGALLTEIAKISKTRADRYNIYGTVDIAPFRDIKDEHQRMLLGYIRQTWQIANEIIDKYS